VTSLAELLREPLLLSPDNFTPPSRTPWGGTRILDRYKAQAPIADERRFAKVGESWEISVEPDFPSRLAALDVTLGEVIAADPSAALGREHARGHASTALLVKLLDSADALSVQIHPADDYDGLDEGEAGKPESWYVLEADEGAGLYLGLAAGVDESTMRAAIASGGDVSALLSFVPVSVGDFFVIEAGTIHAIGPGLTLVEPQHVAPGRRGVTYRYWDWNRRYDASGHPDPEGAPRTLHVEHALAVTAWDRPRGDAFLEAIRYRSGPPDLRASPRIDRLAGSGAAIRSAHLDVRRITGTGEISLDDADVLRGLTVVDGRLTLSGQGFEVLVEKGRSAAIPAAIRGLSAQCEGVHGLICAIA